MRGKLIVFEGVEGSGKTTQMQRVQHWLSQHLAQDVPILTTCEPGGTTLGLELRQLLLKKTQKELKLADRAELLLYAADRAQHVKEVLKPYLEKGAIILCDRYTDSTVAYQGYGRGISLKLIHQLNEIATGGLESDLTLWLDVDVKIGLARARSRGAADRIEQADFTFHQRVQQGYTNLSLAYPQRIVRIEANKSETEVQQQIVEAILQRKFREIIN